jgi:hypothetical protein
MVNVALKKALLAVAGRLRQKKEGKYNFFINYLTE